MESEIGENVLICFCISWLLSVFQCHFVDLVHYMGGNVRRDFKSNITHLVANAIGGEKYEVCLHYTANSSW